MNKNKNKFLKLIKEKLELCVIKLDKPVEYFGDLNLNTQNILRILIDVDILRRLIELYIGLEEEQDIALKQIHVEIITMQQHIVSKYNHLLAINR